MSDIVITGDICAHRLVADFEYAPKTATYRDRPLLTRRCQPVRCDDRRRSEIPAVGKIIVDERLREKFIHSREQRIAANSPLIVDQYADHPMSGRY